MWPYWELHGDRHRRHGVNKAHIARCRKTACPMLLQLIHALDFDLQAYLRALTYRWQKASAVI